MLRSCPTMASILWQSWHEPRNSNLGAHLRKPHLSTSHLFLSDVIDVLGRSLPPDRTSALLAGPSKNGPSTAPTLLRLPSYTTDMFSCVVTGLPNPGRTHRIAAAMNMAHAVPASARSHAGTALGAGCRPDDTRRLARTLGPRYLSRLLLYKPLNHDLTMTVLRSWSTTD